MLEVSVLITGLTHFVNHFPFKSTGAGEIRVTSDRKNLYFVGKNYPLEGLYLVGCRIGGLT
jgi:hypothetical protein